MRITISIIIALFYFSSYSQAKKYIYVDSDKDYVIFLDNELTSSKKEMGSTLIDVFVKTTNTQFNYTLLISKIFEHNFKAGNLLNDAYEKYFLDTCDCDILDKEIVYYNNLKTIRFKIKAINNGKVFIGYNDSFVGNDLLYNILFLTFEDDFEREVLEYKDIMNTLIINGATTINGYSVGE